MKIIRITLFIIALTSCSFSFGQNSDTVYYKVLRNDPNNINNLFIYAMPLNLDFLISYINISYGFGAEYNHKDRFTLGVDFKRSYTEKLNDLFQGDPSNGLYSKIGHAVDKKNFMIYEFSAQYLLGGKIRTHNEKPVMNDGLNTTTYIKIKTKHYIAFALRASYAQQQYNLTNTTMNDLRFNYKAYKLDEPNIIFDDLAGSTMYTLQFVSFGLGLFQKQDLKIATDSYGTKDYSMITTYYFDILLPVSQELANLEVSDRSGAHPTNYEVNVNDHTPMTNYGFRVGMKWQNVATIRNINAGTKFEIGFLPGPNKLTNNFFISLGLDLNISFDTRK
jgi:hypothetical protein